MVQTNTEERPIEDPLLKSFLLFFYCAIIFLLPIKFSSNILLLEVPVPILHSISDFVNTEQWPWFFFAVASGSGLFLSVMAYPNRRERKRALLYPVFWAGLALTTYLSRGFFAHYHKEFSIYLASLAAFTAGIQIVFNNHPKAPQWFIRSLILSLVYTTFYGLYQYFWGFDAAVANIPFMEEQLGRKMSELELFKMRQRLLQSTFIYPNTYAGFLVAIAPACLVYIWQKKSEPLYKFGAILLGLVTFTNLALSQSKAAFISIALAGLISLAIFTKQNKIRMGAIALLVIGSLAFVYAIAYTPLLASGEVRFQYYLSSISLFLKSPLIGDGPGAFLVEHQMRKPAGFEVSRIPHSFIGTAMQSGLFAVIAALLCLISPLRNFFQQKRYSPYQIAVFLGLITWIIHSQLEIHSRVIALCTAFIILSFIYKKPKTYRRIRPLYNYFYNSLFLLLATVSCLAITQLPGAYYYSEQFDEANKIPEPSFAHLQKLRESLQIGLEQNADRLFLNESVANQCLDSFFALEGKEPLLAEAYLLLQETCLKKCTELAPQWHRLHEKLSENLYRQKKLIASAKALREAQKLYPYSPQVLELGKIIFREVYRRHPKSYMAKKEYFQIIRSDIECAYKIYLSNKRYAPNQERTLASQLHLKQQVLPFLSFLERKENAKLAELWQEELLEIQRLSLPNS